jgi:hypothetical protein
VMIPMLDVLNHDPDTSHVDWQVSFTLNFKNTLFTQ